ncbi:MAG: plasmid stabilization protein [Bacteroidetes bacterium GWA2_30_7]|nr:MAG: plasmid stabilization protein [Bacteroidetes bacterium GWA2_30_7]
MLVLSKKSFNKDLKKINDKKLAQRILEVIESLKNADSIDKVLNIKKLKGSTNAYRIKIGDFRLGFFLKENTIELTIFEHRKDIYKKFP